MKIRIARLLLIMAFIAFPVHFVSAQVMSYMPRVYLTGLGGTSLVGRGDLLVPTYLTNNGNLFVYGMGRASYKYNNDDANPWTGSAGLGYRYIVDNKAMLGIYCLADYTNSPAENFLVIGPGIEAIGRLFEFRANAYFPTDKTDWKTQGFADKFGDYSKNTFIHNSQYDHWYVYHEEIGPGCDADFGLKIAKIGGVLVKGYVNGYYFNMRDNDDVIGGGARLTAQPANYLKFSLAYSYDKYEEHTFLAGIQLSLYDLFDSDRRHAKVDTQDLHQHLFDPLERQFGTLGIAKAVPITRYNDVEDLGPYLERKNVWFWDGGGSSLTPSNNSGDGTHEHPFTPDEFTQATIDSLPDDAIMYFNHANYPCTNVNNPIRIYAGQSMEGRSQNFTAPAALTARPIFLGSLEFVGNVTADRIIVKDNVATTNIAAGIIVLGSNVNLSNVEVDVTGPTSKPGALMPIIPIGINVIKNGVVNFTGGVNVVNATGNNAEDIWAKDGSTVNLKQGTNTIANEIFVSDGSSLNIIDGNNTIGHIDADNVSNINLNGGTNTIVAIFANFSSHADFANGNNTIGRIDDANMSKLNFTGGTNTVAAIFADYSSHVNFVNGDNAVNNIDADNMSELNFTGGRNKIDAVCARNGAYVNFVNGDNTVNNIDADDVSELSFAGGTNTINVVSISELSFTGGINTIATIFAKNGAYVNFVNGDNIVNNIDADNMSELNFTGGRNKIDAVYAKHGVHVDFVNGDNTVDHLVVTDIDTLVSFNGGTNTIDQLDVNNNAQAKFNRGNNILGNTDSNGHALNVNNGNVYFNDGSTNIIYGMNITGGGEVHLDGGTNNILSTIDINGSASKLFFNGGENTVDVDADNASGINVDDGVVTFSGGTNTIIATGDGNVFGINLLDGIVDFAGGENTINVASGDNGIGIFTHGGQIEFGGDIAISSNNIINVTSDNGAAVGIAAFNSRICFDTNSNNYITATSENGEATGITSWGSTIIFPASSYSSNDYRLHITVQGDNASGIIADNTSLITEDGVKAMDPDTLLNSFADIRGGTGGYKVNWDGHGSEWVISW